MFTFIYYFAWYHVKVKWDCLLITKLNVFGHPVKELTFGVEWRTGDIESSSNLSPWWKRSLTVVFSKHLKRWWCCSSKTSSLKLSSTGMPAAFAAILASAAFFLDTNAAPEVAFAICMRASRAFCNDTERNTVGYIIEYVYTKRPSS